MNFLSKLIIFVIASIIIVLSFLSFKINDLTNSSKMVHSKFEKIDAKLNYLSSNKAIERPIESSIEDPIDELKTESKEEQKEQQKEESSEKPTLELEKEYFGIDVSHWNGDIVSEISENSDISFVICKATQGEKIIDPQFKRNWALSKKRNKIRGAYHFYIYQNDPVKQASHFCDIVGDLQKTDISLILDIEELSLPKNNVNKVKLKTDLINFLEQVEKRTGRVPILYTDYSFANQYLNDIKFSRYPLWLAEYAAKKPRLPIAWKKTGLMILQKSNDYSINSTKEDFDVFRGIKKDLYK
jgi:lysozyme